MQACSTELGFCSYFFVSSEGLEVKTLSLLFRVDPGAGEIAAGTRI